MGLVVAKVQIPIQKFRFSRQLKARQVISLSNSGSRHSAQGFSDCSNEVSHLNVEHVLKPGHCPAGRVSRHSTMKNQPICLSQMT